MRKAPFRRKLTLRDVIDVPLVTLSVGGQEEGAVGGFILGAAGAREMFDRRALERRCWPRRTFPARA
jgi:hypothetical protein